MVTGRSLSRSQNGFDSTSTATVRVLRSVGMELLDTHLAHWQQERVLRNHVLDFPEFRQVSLFDSGGRLLATSRLVRTPIDLPDPGAFRRPAWHIAPLKSTMTPSRRQSSPSA